MDMELMAERLLGLMKDAEHIHFNTSGFSALAFGKMTPLKMYRLGASGIGQGNMTAWEFYKTVKYYQSKATFYLDGATKSLWELGLQMERDVKELIEMKGPWYLWVMTYGMTHGAMRLALHHGEFASRIELHSIGSTYFKGELQGGPYELRVEQTEPDQLLIHDTRNELVFDCSDIRIGSVRPLD